VNLLADGERIEVGFPEAGIPIKAELPDGSIKSVDLAHLQPASLLAWLRSRGGFNPTAEATVLALMGHDSALAHQGPPGARCPACGGLSRNG